MQRNKKPDLILTADWHLREDTPICFTGDWHQEQWKAVEVVRGLQATYGCSVVHAGDLFHHWKPSPGLLSQALWFLPEKFYTIYGQHDLPQHNFQLRSNSGLHTLEVAGKIEVLPNCHYGQEPDIMHPSLHLVTNQAKTQEEYWERRILVWHYMTYVTPPFPGATEGQSIGILKKYPQFDLICTGDNHQSFFTEYKGRLLVNPGSLTRQSAKQIDFKPRVYLWYAETNTVEPVYLPIQDGVISKEHLDNIEKRDARIEAFISQLDKDWIAEMSFEDNLEHFREINNISDGIMNIIYKALEYERK